MQLQLDRNGAPIQALGLAYKGARADVTTSGSSQRVGPFLPTTKVISMYAVEDVRVEVGDSTVVATSTSHFIPKGQYILISLTNQDGGVGSHLAVLQSTAAGKFYVSERA